uniref:Tyrosine-protein kinase n=1 Tax=Parascaris equorum TaxID=6256 RepID=A0A914RXY2_PAREQ
MTTKGFDLLPKGVEETPFYHGLLPREDVVELLAEVGDFMLRISQPKHTDPRELIISVRVAKDTCPSSAIQTTNQTLLQIRHIIVRRQKLPQGEVKYLAVEALGFDSVDELLQHYRKQKTPINPQIRLKKLLGAGAFGEVRAGEVTIKGKKVECAIKLRMERRGSPSYPDDALPVKGGSVLSDLRKRRGTVSDEEKLNNMTLGSAKGLAYLHSKGCIHRDIAARNVLYTKDKIVPIKWTAPETITTFIYSLKTDVFSFSIFMWEVFSDGMDPYKGLTNTTVKKMQEPKARWSMDTVVREQECIIKKEAAKSKNYPSTTLKGSKQERHVKQINESFTVNFRVGEM